MKQPMSVVVRGNEHQWVFHFKGEPEYLAEWRADGLEVYEVEHVIPSAVVDAGLTMPLIWLQRLWKALRLW